MVVLGRRQIHGQRIYDDCNDGIIECCSFWGGLIGDAGRGHGGVLALTNGPDSSGAACGGHSLQDLVGVMNIAAKAKAKSKAKAMPKRTQALQMPTHPIKSGNHTVSCYEL